MGGGAAMRAAAKAAGIGGIRSAEHPISAAARRATTTRSVSTPEEVSWTGLSSASQNNPIESAAVVQRPCWELDDWEFAGAEEESAVVRSAGEPLPRLVFGGAPTLEEAKEATTELKDALDKIYLSFPNLSGNKEAGHESALSLVPKLECLETNAYAISETTTKTLPTNALKAFRLLKESTAVQSVVASIASDPNVWHAVLQNEALSGLLESQKGSTPFLDKLVTNEYAADTFPVNQSAKSIDDESSVPGKSSESGSRFMNIVEGIKSTVAAMMNRLSDYFSNLFGGPSENTDAGPDASAGLTFGEKAMGASFIGLAVMVIMVVVLKRR